MLGVISNMKYLLLILLFPLCTSCEKVNGMYITKRENPSYTEFKKQYTVLMIDKMDTTASIGKDNLGNIWKFTHTYNHDWTVVKKVLIGPTHI